MISRSIKQHSKTTALMVCPALRCGVVVFVSCCVGSVIDCCVWCCAEVKFYPNPEANWGPKARAQPKRKRDGSGGGESGDDEDGSGGGGGGGEEGGDGGDGDHAMGGTGEEDDHTNDGDALRAKSIANQGKNQRRKKCRTFETVSPALHLIARLSKLTHSLTRVLWCACIRPACVNLVISANSNTIQNQRAGYRPYRPTRKPALRFTPNHPHLSQHRMPRRLHPSPLRWQQRVNPRYRERNPKNFANSKISKTIKN